MNAGSLVYKSRQGIRLANLAHAGLLVCPAPAAGQPVGNQPVREPVSQPSHSAGPPELVCGPVWQSPLLRRRRRAVTGVKHSLVWGSVDDEEKPG
ncbi:MAG: hypothetical protein OXC07_11840 [Kistimonas sp.]|nr:hypothetical protein [Kistimonas sp.]